MYWGRIVIVIGVLTVIAALVYWIVTSSRLMNQGSEQWWVAGQSVDCVGVSVQRCLQVKKSETGSYENFYDQIAGFEYVEGTSYVLRVKVGDTVDVPADASMKSYTLIEVISEETVPYIQLVSPQTGASVPVGEQLLIQGRGRGLFENNVIVRLLDANQREVAQAVTTMIADDVGGEGQWSVSFPSAQVLSGKGYIQAISPSPQDSTGDLMFRVPVTFVVESGGMITLENTQWNLVEYMDDADSMTEALPTSTLRLADGSVNGNGGCNNYFGTYTLEDERISFSGMGSTLMYCEDLMEQESRMLALLEQIRTFVQEGNTLQLYGDDERILLSFEAAEPLALEGTRWQVTRYNNGKEAIVTVMGGTEMTAEFSEGTMAGSAGCNNYTMSYEATGSDMILGQAAVTRKLCPEPEGIMEQEQEYLAALGEVKTFVLTDSELTLYNAEGIRYVIYEPMVDTER